MIRALALLIAILGFGTFAGSVALTPPIECHLLTLTKLDNTSASPERYCGRDQAELQSIWEELEAHRLQVAKQISDQEAVFSARMMELSERARTRRDDAIIEEPEGLRALRLEQINVIIEQNDVRSAMRIQDLNVGLLGLLAGGAGTVLFVLSLFVGSLGGSPVPKAFAKAVTHRETEQWVEPIAAEGLLATLDVKKKFAVERLFALRPAVCSYCGKPLPLEPTGKVEHVTLLKKAPEDVTAPKKIVLGTGFRALPPDAVTCEDCGHKNQL